MVGTFYGIGVGPGDPELLTIKAVKALQTVAVLAVPESKKDMGSVAYDIAKSYINDDIRILSLTFPMIRDKELKANIRRENAMLIYNELIQGHSVAFLTLGDPMLYSTYMYIVDYLKENGIEPISIPGIYSFSAISNSLNQALVMDDESLAVISKLTDSDWIALQQFKSVVCMKISSYGKELFDCLLSTPDWNFVMVSNAGKSNEVISYDVNDLLEPMHYFTSVIISKKYYV